MSVSAVSQSIFVNNRLGQYQSVQTRTKAKESNSLNQSPSFGLDSSGGTPGSLNWKIVTAGLLCLVTFLLVMAQAGKGDVVSVLKNLLGI